jgi:7-carboxy-7-deazaguanine synthase
MFTSRQGEGTLTGTDSYFIRTSGCNLRCWFCDTPYASWEPSGIPTTIESIVAAVVDSEHQHVVLTGGEPMLPKESVALCHALKKAGCHITIETAGTIDRDLPCDLMSISPKLRSSTPDGIDHPKWSKLHETRRLPIKAMQNLIVRSEDFQLKFVVDSPADYCEVIETVKQIGVKAEKVFIMPQGSTIEAMDEATLWLKPWAIQQGYHYCDRMQIRWFGNRRGT